MKPLGQKVLVKLDEIKSVSSGGIIIPDQYKKKDLVTFGLVIEIGNKVLDVVPGDRIAVSKHDGSDLKIDGIDHVLIEEKFIYGVCNE